MLTKMYTRLSAIEKKHAETNEAGISNRFDDEYFKLNPMQVGQLHRRYWTYYSEVELAMSQGKLANWTSGVKIPYPC